jgi:hypothetical protein
MRAGAFGIRRGPGAKVCGKAPALDPVRAFPESVGAPLLRPKDRAFVLGVVFTNSDIGMCLRCNAALRKLYEKCLFDSGQSAKQVL